MCYSFSNNDLTMLLHSPSDINSAYASCNIMLLFFILYNVLFIVILFILYCSLPRLHSFAENYFSFRSSRKCLHPLPLSL